MDDNQQSDNTQTSDQAPGEVLDLLTVQDAIKTRIEQLDKLKEDIKPIKEMLDSFLENSDEYREKSEAAKKASKEKSGVKARLMAQPQAADNVNKINAIKEQMKDVQEGLSYYLREYQRLTGANEIEGADGELRQIVYVAKLVRKTNLNRE